MMPYTVLIVEDHPLNQKLLCDFLKMKKFHCVTCITGEEAIDVIRELPPDIVLLDLNLSSTSGLEVAWFIRNVLKLDNLPLVAISAQVFPETKALARKVGFNDFVEKPIDLQKLYHAMCELLEKQQKPNNNPNQKMK